MTSQCSDKSRKRGQKRERRRKKGWFRKRTALGEPVETELSGRLARARAGGVPLTKGFRLFAEQAMGADFSPVRIHRDTAADQLARSINALAFTNTTHIFFRSGQYDEQSASGRRLLAHELTHILQQNSSLKSIKGTHLQTRAEIQRQKAPEAARKRVVGKFQFIDEANKVLGETTVTAYQDIPPGVYDAIFTPPDRPVKVTFSQLGITIKVLELSRKHLRLQAKAARIQLVVAEPGAKKRPTKEPEEAYGKAHPGSKYGVFGWLKLPQKAIDLLETMVTVLGDTDEALALKELLELVKDIVENRSEIKSLLGDSDRLVSVLLGIENGGEATSKSQEQVQKAIGTALSKLEQWVNKPILQRKVRKTPETRGLLKFIAKLRKLFGKVRLVLRPVFKGRAAFQSALGTIEAVLEEIPVLEELWEKAESGAISSETKRLIKAFSTELAKGIQGRLEAVRESLSLRIATFTEHDLVSKEEVAGAITSALPMLLPRPLKKLAQKIRKIPGVETVSDQVVKKILPNFVVEIIVEVINDLVRDLVKRLSPTIKEAQRKIESIFKATEAKLVEYLIPEITKIFVQPYLRPGAARVEEPGPAFHALLTRSREHGLPDDIRGEFEAVLGHDFGGVRVHHDAAAQTASDAIRAAAFTIGPHIYFSHGQYTPGTSEGRRLLAHELTHVVQQRRGLQAGVIQRDAKKQTEKLTEGLTKPFVRHVGGKLVRGIKEAKKFSPTPEEIERMRAQTRGIIGKTPESILLPEGYRYVREKRTGKLRAIRRLTKWISHLDPLRIAKDKRTGTIQIQYGRFRARVPEEVKEFIARLKIKFPLLKQSGLKAIHRGYGKGSAEEAGRTTQKRWTFIARLRNNSNVQIDDIMPDGTLHEVKTRQEGSRRLEKEKDPQSPEYRELVDQMIRQSQFIEENGLPKPGIWETDNEDMEYVLQRIITESRRPITTIGVSRRRRMKGKLTYRPAGITNIKVKPHGTHPLKYE